MTEVMSDEDLMILFDWEHDLTCESVLGCDNAAEWICAFRCCDKKLMLCDSCKRRCVILEEDRIAKGLIFNCGWCKKSTDKYPTYERI